MCWWVHCFIKTEHGEFIFCCWELLHLWTLQLHKSEEKKTKNNVCQEFPENKVMSWEFLTGWRRTAGLSSSPTGEREKEKEEKSGGGGEEETDGGDSLH